MKKQTVIAKSCRTLTSTKTSSAWVFAAIVGKMIGLKRTGASCANHAATQSVDNSEVGALAISGRLAKLER